MPKTLLYLIDYYLPHKGGVESVFEQIISRSLQEGYQVIVLTSHYSPELPQKEKSWSLTIIRTGKGRLAFIFWGIWRGMQILRSFPSIQLIHASTYWGAIPASLLGMLFRKPVLLTVHEIFWKLRNRYKSRKTARLYRLFERMIFQLSFVKYHCVSLYTLNALRLVYGIPDKKLFLAYNGVDYEFWSREKVSKQESLAVQKKFWLIGKRNLLYFGHTGISKGIDTLVEAIPELLEQDSELQLIFNLIPAQRDTFIKAKIQTFLADLPPSQKGRVKIWNGLPKEELRALVANVQAVVAPSLSEGFWSVHTETLAMKTPLITTQIASLPEVIWGKAIFFSPWDKKELIAAVAHLKSEKYIPLPEKKFSWDKQYAILLEQYQNLWVHSELSGTRKVNLKKPKH